jgi:spermidine synthase
MGATFPLLVREAADRGVPAQTAVSVLYGANTVGAAAGALIGSFAFLPLLGTRLSFAAAGGLNALAGTAALVLARAWRADRRDAPPGTVPDAPRLALSPGGRRLTATISALSGATGAVLQVGWTRAMTLVFGSSVYALGLTLAAYILGLGLGPFAARWRPFREVPETRRAAGAQWLLGVSSLLLIPALGSLPSAAALLSGLMERAPVATLLLQFVIVSGLILLPSMAQGATFPALAVLAGGGRDEAHESAGRIYAATTWGSVAGFIAAGFLLVPSFGTSRTLALASATALFLSARLASARSLPGSSPAGPGRLAPVLLAAAPLLLLALPAWDRDLMTGGGFLYGPVYHAAAAREPLRLAVRRRGDIVFYADRGEGLVTVRRSPAGILSLQINGKTEASTGGDMATQILAAHLPLLAHPHPERVLVIGLASGITLGGVGKHPVTSIQAIEIAPAVVQAARAFDEANGGALDDPRLDLVLDDARSRLLVRPDRFDVITSQPSNPWVAGVSNLFTREFYRLVRSRLRPGGLFCQWVQAYRIDPEDLRGIVRSFLEVYPDATLWEESAGGGDYFLLGGDGPLRLDPARLAAAGDPVWRDLARGGVDGPADFLTRFVAGPRGLAAFSAGARVHTDDDLYLEWRAPLSLLRDAARLQPSALNRYREPVLSILREGAYDEDPALAAALGKRQRSREARLAVAESLREADLNALRDPFLAAGIEFLRGGRYVEAVGALARAAADEPENAGTHLLLGEAYGLAGLEDASIVAYEEAVRKDPGMAPAWNALGRQLVRRGRQDAARAAFSRAVLGDPGLAVAHNNLGATLLQAGDLKSAEQSIREALRLDPQLPAAIANLGIVFKKRGDLADALRQYHAALELDPLNVDARYNLAETLRTAGRDDEARRELLEVLRIDPGDPDATRALREIDASRGRSQAERSKGTS